MTDTDDFLTSTYKLGAIAFDAWLTVFKGIATTAAEVINPDDFIAQENYETFFVDDDTADGPICLGWLTPKQLPRKTSIKKTKVAGAVSPYVLGMSSAGLTPSENPMEVAVWVKDPTTLPDLPQKTYHCLLYVATQPNEAVFDFTIDLVKKDPQSPTPYK